MAGGYPGNPQVEELQRRREKLRQEIKEVEARSRPWTAWTIKGENDEGDEAVRNNDEPGG